MSHSCRFFFPCLHLRADKLQLMNGQQSEMLALGEHMYSFGRMTACETKEVGQKLTKKI